MKNMHVTKLLTTKNFTDKRLHLFKEKINNYTKLLDLPETLKEFTLVADYLNAQSRRRAQTVGSAFDIAFKLFLALKHPKASIKQYLKHSVFTKEPEVMKEASTKLAEYDASLEQLFYNTLERVEELKVNKEGHIPFNSIVNYAVTLAWFEAYEKSGGYFPKDLEVVNPQSFEHATLVAEVTQLLEVAKNDFTDFLLTKDKIIFNPEFDIDTKDLVLEGTGDLIAGDTLIDIKTTGNIKTNHSNYMKQVLSYFELNKMLNKYDIKNIGLYYVRFNQIHEIEGVEIPEQKFEVVEVKKNEIIEVDLKDIDNLLDLLGEEEYDKQ